LSYTDRDRTIALAGMFQAASLTQELARTGKAASEPLSHSLASVFVADANRAEDVFSGLEGVASGLQTIRAKFDARGSGQDIEVARYVISMIQLEARLRRTRGVMDALSNGIDGLKNQAEYFRKASGEDELHPTVIENLADLYSSTLSNLPPRIMVSGEPEFIRSDAIAARIRAVLLAGVRAAVLWHQVGGRRWHLVFKRSRFVDQARRLLEELREPRAVH
jgi:high frequency lysogenization protein